MTRPSSVCSTPVSRTGLVSDLSWTFGVLEAIGDAYREPIIACEACRRLAAAHAELAPSLFPEDVDTRCEAHRPRGLPSWTM